MVRPQAPRTIQPQPRTGPRHGTGAGLAGVRAGNQHGVLPGRDCNQWRHVPGALIGAVAGAVLGHQVGGGSGRDAATVLGGAAGAAVGSQVGRPSGATTSPTYRVSIQTDQGAMRVYDVPTPGDLRVGDRVRVENGVIYRS